MDCSETYGESDGRRLALLLIVTELVAAVWERFLSSSAVISSLLGKERRRSLNAFWSSSSSGEGNNVNDVMFDCLQQRFQNRQDRYIQASGKNVSPTQWMELTSCCCARFLSSWFSLLPEALTVKIFAQSLRFNKKPHHHKAARY
jgi:hypothetical protein